jgi:hypothetical protein
MQRQYGGNSTTVIVFYLASDPRTQELFAQSEPTIYIEHLQWDPYISLVSNMKICRSLKHFGCVPYIEAISPRDVAIAVEPKPAKMHPYTSEEGPPL